VLYPEFIVASSRYASLGEEGYRRERRPEMRPSEERRGTTLTTTAEEIDRLRLKYGFWIIIAGFALVAFHHHSIDLQVS
jgi:hypothetical protein